MDSISLKSALVAGAAAGLAVDVSLFPLDTIKTRLQSEKGFLKSGGFRGVYSGLFSAAIGSAPTSAVFFLTYESSKSIFNKTFTDRKLESYGHMLAASCGEVSACLIRVPVEVVKQRTQALEASSSFSSFKKTLSTEGIRGFYRGYFSTVIREIPFSAMQFPLWEYLKSRVSQYNEKPITASQSALCGALSGGISAGITTPLDVAKTRIMLAKKGSKLAEGSILIALRHVYVQNGIKGLFAGLGPRVTWISIGGSIFLGVYEKVRIVISSIKN